MKLTRLHVAQLKQFRHALDITDLADGINVFVGDNETGKSTLVEAIRAAFFERHKSASVSHLQPWGNTSAAPEVVLEFDWRDTPWRLHKRFLKSKRCDLHVGPEHCSGDDAEDRLAALLGYSLASRGASKPEHHGIPGLLWVEQGAVQDIRDPASHAGEHLQAALGNTLGEVTSSSGDALMTQVEKARGQLLTATGKATGEYKKTLQQCEHGDARLHELNQAISDYEQQVDELARLRRKQRDIDTARPWQAQRDQAQAAQQRLAEVQDWQAQQQADEQALARCQHNQQLYREQLQDFAADAERLTQRAQDKARAQEALDTSKARKPQLQEQLAAARDTYAQADKTLRQARHEAARARLHKEHANLNTSMAALKKNLDKARSLHDELQQLRVRQQTTAIDTNALEQLKTVTGQLGELGIQQQALASRVEYELQPDHYITIGADTVSGHGERLLLDTTELAIPNVGTLRLKPGGTDVAELRRRQQQLHAERDALLRQLAIDDLDAGEQRANADRELCRQIGEKAATLAGLAPDGVEALASQYQLSDSQRAQLAAQLAEYGHGEPQGVDEKSAENALATAHNRLKAVEEAAHTHASELGMAQQALDTAAAEWDKLNTELQAPQRKQREQQANDALVDVNAEVQRLQMLLRERQDKIDAARPDTLAQDVERHNQSADVMEQEAVQREKAVDRLQVTLEALGAKGLGEQRETQQQDTQRLHRRRDELTRRAEALDLLLGLLRDKRQALTRQLQAPLQKHLNHYLQLLFPTAQLSVDDNLIPATLDRNWAGSEEQGDVQALSYGVREQMGLISRLAYADLLQAAGKPTLIILDDALVHCDATRLEQMKRILFDAARRHQILLFSCHPDNWRDLGVVPHDLQAMKTAAT